MSYCTIFHFLCTVPSVKQNRVFEAGISSIATSNPKTTKYESKSSFLCKFFFICVRENERSQLEINKYIYNQNQHSNPVKLDCMAGEKIDRLTESVRSL